MIALVRSTHLFPSSANDILWPGLALRVHFRMPAVSQPVFPPRPVPRFPQHAIPRVLHLRGDVTREDRISGANDRACHAVRDDARGRDASEVNSIRDEYARNEPVDADYHRSEREGGG